MNKIVQPSHDVLSSVIDHEEVNGDKDNQFLNQKLIYDRQSERHAKAIVKLDNSAIAEVHCLSLDSLPVSKVMLEIQTDKSNSTHRVCL